MGEPYDHVVRKLEERGLRVGQKFRCPAHDDHDPSLSVNEGDDGRVLLYCHAGCVPERIVEALELTMSDLFKANGGGPPRSKSKTVATYNYVDESGDLLFQVRRLEPKGFWQQRPDGKGGWIPKLDGVRPVLYRLPRVLQAVEAGETVYIVEGEKDVESMEGAGAVATCNPGGVGKWRDEYSKALVGASCRIIADNDTPGRKHAREVASSLQALGIGEELLGPAKGKDATDHLNAGFGLDDFLPLPPESDPSLDSFTPSETRHGISDPGPLPTELLRVPGFISEVMDYCLKTAPYPNIPMAFAGALALQAVLAGRKVRDPGDNRTNIYLLGLAHSSAGKDRPRKINAEILNAVGLSRQIGGSFASGEGIQDALFAEPCMVFQTDEIDGMLQSINKSREARYEGIMGTLLTMYSSANSIFPMRRKAGMESPGTIDQPCLVIFGTAIPNHYYEALSERMLTNGFFARMIILECGTRSAGQEPRLLALPARVLETARWWADFTCGTRKTDTWQRVPQIVPQTDQAKAVLTETRLEAEAEYAKAEAIDDSVGTAVWGRVSEHARKLSLIYAVSQNHQHPQIDKAGAEWASQLVLYQARRMLFMAQSHVADSAFQADCLKLLRKLRDAPNQELSHSVLLKRMKIDARSFDVLVTTLAERGDIIKLEQATPGRTGRYYLLAEGRGEA